MGPGHRDARPAQRIDVPPIADGAASQRDDDPFEARESAAGAGNAFGFTLSVEDKNYVYNPTFGAGPKFLLTGMERAEEK